METRKVTKSHTEWTIESVKDYLLKNPDKKEHIYELRKMPEDKRIEMWVGLVKKTSQAKSSAGEFVGFAIYVLGLRNIQLDELLTLNT